MDKPTYLTGTITSITTNDVTIDGRVYKLGNKAKQTLHLPDGSWAFVPQMVIKYFTSEDGTVVLWMGIPGKPKAPSAPYTAPAYPIQNPPTQAASPSVPIQETYAARRQDRSLDVGNSIMWQSMMKNATELVKAKYSLREEAVTKDQVVSEIVELTDALYEASIRKMLGLTPLKKAGEADIR
jgi:hypothetical protein